jgi:hypothetical protein
LREEDNQRALERQAIERAMEETQWKDAMQQLEEERLEAQEDYPRCGNPNWPWLCVSFWKNHCLSARPCPHHIKKQGI